MLSSRWWPGRSRWLSQRFRPPARPRPPDQRRSDESRQALDAPKTPSGDPDLQGTWTTDSAFGIPLQRPQQFAGRAELNDEEFAQKVDRDTCTRSNAETQSARFVAMERG